MLQLGSERETKVSERSLLPQLTAESCFCCQFSATSQSISQEARMQVVWREPENHSEENTHSGSSATCSTAYQKWDTTTGFQAVQFICISRRGHLGLLYYG